MPYDVYNSKDRWLARIVHWSLAPMAYIWRVFLQRPMTQRDPERILVVRLDNIGDVIMTTPMIEALKIIYPEAKIDILILPEAKPILQHHPAVDKLIPFKAFWFNPTMSHGKKVAWSMFKFLKSQHYDMAIDPRGDIRNQLFLLLLGIPERIGFDRTGGAYMLTKALTYVPSMHFTRQMLRCAQCLSPGHAFDDVPRIFLGEESQKEALEWRQKENLMDQPYAMVFPCSKMKSKEWDYTKMGGLCRELHNKGWRVVLLGSPSEKNSCEIVNQHSGGICTIAAGQLSLMACVAMMDDAELVVSNDSAPAHMAAAREAKCLLIWGPMDITLSAPVHRQPSKVDLIVHRMPCSFCNSIKVLPPQCRNLPKPQCIDGISLDQACSRLA